MQGHQNMRRILIMGAKGVGKRTLSNLIEGEQTTNKNNLDLYYRKKTIIAPGEFLEQTWLNNALIMVSQNQAYINLFLINSLDNSYYPPAFANSFTKRNIGVITKIDLMDEKNYKKSYQMAEDLGLDQIVAISNKTQDGLEKLIEIIKEAEA